MKEKSKEHSLKEMKLIMTCLTIICFCCTFITIFQNAILCFELGTNQAAICLLYTSPSPRDTR